MRKVFTGLLAASLAGAMLMACGGDDSNGASPGDDGGLNDGQIIPPIDGASPGTDAGKMPGTDSGGDAGGCNFATFVKGLVANQTTATALPSTDLGQSCTDNHDQAEFRSLFP